MPTIFQHNQETDGPISDFSVVAVKDGVAVASIVRVDDAPGGLPQLMIPDYSTFISLFDGTHIFIAHEPVKQGTEWDGEKFIIPDTSDFVPIGDVSE